jgi:hypothetical protein
MMLSKQDIRYLYQFIAKKNWRVLRSWFEDLKRIRGIIGRCQDQFRPLSEFSIARNCITNNHTIYEHALAGNEKETFDDSEGHDWYMDDVWVPAPVTCGITAASAISPEATAGWPTSYPYSLSATEMAEMVRQQSDAVARRRQEQQRIGQEMVERVQQNRSAERVLLPGTSEQQTQAPEFLSFFRVSHVPHTVLYYPYEVTSMDVKNVGENTVMLRSIVYGSPMVEAVILPGETCLFENINWTKIDLICLPDKISLAGVRVLSRVASRFIPPEDR